MSVPKEAPSQRALTGYFKPSVAVKYSQEFSTQRK